MAEKQYRLEADQDDEDDADLDDDGTMLEDEVALPGVTETRIDATEAQQIEQRLQQRLPDGGGDD